MTLYDRPIRNPEVLERAKMTFELYEAAEQIMRQNLRRRHPDLSTEEIEERLVEWLHKEPEKDGYIRPSTKWAERFGQLP